MTAINTHIYTENENDAELDEPHFSHIVWGDENESADAKITRARVEGTPVTALCGYTWVPSRDPQKYPVCEKCLETAQFIKACRS